MGKIEQLVKSKLLGNDNPNNLVWPITKTQAVYDKTNTDLQTVLDSLGSEIQEIKEINNISVRYDQVQELTEEQKGTARNNIGAGTGNYNKPSGGIPKSDLVMSIQESLEKLDNLSVEYGDSMLFDAQRPLCFVPMSILVSSGFLDVEAANDLPIFGGETTGMYLILQNYCAASNSVRYSSVHTMKHNQEDITYLVYALSTNGTWSFGYYEVPSGVIDEASNSEIDALFD